MVNKKTSNCNTLTIEKPKKAMGLDSKKWYFIDGKKHIKLLNPQPLSTKSSALAECVYIFIPQNFSEHKLAKPM